LQRNVNLLILLFGVHVNEDNVSETAQIDAIEDERHFWPKENPGMKKVLLVLAALFSMSVFASAQTGVAGKWTSAQPGRGGAAGTPLTLELAVANTTLTGMMMTGSNSGVAIADGKVDGTKVTFK
jgi:hypothetical protein